MKTIEYTIKDALGIHARPAGLLVKEAGKFASKIMIASPKKEVDAKRIMGVMGLGVKCGDTIKLTIEGEDEEGVAIEISSSAKDAPEEAMLGGHGTSEYYLVRDFLSSIMNDTKPPIDIVRALDMSVPGLIAHECAKEGGVWKDIPLFWR